MDGFYNAFCRVLHFFILQPVVRKSSQCYHCTSTIFLPRKKYCQESSRPFNGTAWRCRNRDNISTIDDVVSDFVLPTPPALQHYGDPDPYRTVGRTSVFVSHTARSSDQSWHHETWLRLQFVEWSSQWNHQAHYNGNIQFKGRPASAGNKLQNIT